MNKTRRQSGFSLLEALLATGILGVGLVLIAMVFPVGVKLTSIAAERTVGSVAANEAFAKIQLWGMPQNWPQRRNLTGTGYFSNVSYLALLNEKYTVPGWTTKDLTWPELQYPSAAAVVPDRTHYHWSALCRRLDDRQVQVTVFTTRKAAANIQYLSLRYNGDVPNREISPWPSPIPVALQFNDEDNPRHLRVIGDQGNQFWNETLNQGAVFAFFSGGTILLDDETGRIYHVMEYRASASGGPRDTLVLTEPRQWADYELGAPAPAGNHVLKFWVVPPGIGATRSPVIGVVQKTITID